MPLTDGSNPTAMVGQQAPAMGTPAPQGAGFQAAPSAGLPPAQAGNPQTTMMLGQMAAKLLEKQKGKQYAVQLSNHLRAIVQKLLAAGMLDNPQAESDLATIIQKFGSFADKVNKTGPSTSPALTTSLSDMVNAGSGATR